MSALEPRAAALHGDRAGGHKMRCLCAVQRDERHGSHGGMEARTAWNNDSRDLKDEN